MGHEYSPPNNLKQNLDSIDSAINSSNHLSSDELWQRISGSLRSIIPFIKAGGEQLSEADVPDLGTIRDAARNFVSLDNKLIDLIDWLEYQEGFWMKLQECINNARCQGQEYLIRDVRGDISTYLVWFDECFDKKLRKASLNDIQRMNRLRMKMGERIIKFAAALNRALQETETYKLKNQKP